MISKTFVEFNPAHLVESVAGILHVCLVLTWNDYQLQWVSSVSILCRYSDHQFSFLVSLKLFL